VGAADYRMVEVESFDRMWRLPPGGFGNGLDDARGSPWSMSAMHRSLTRCWTRCSQLGVPAYAAPLPHLETVRPHLRRVGGGPAPVRIWAGATRYGKARDVLLGLLPRLVDEHGEDVIR
jgi:hypothetical protein